MTRPLQPVQPRASRLPLRRKVVAQPGYLALFTTPHPGRPLGRAAAATPVWSPATRAPHGAGTHAVHAAHTRLHSPHRPFGNAAPAPPINLRHSTGGTRWPALRLRRPQGCAIGPSRRDALPTPSARSRFPPRSPGRTAPTPPTWLRSTPASPARPPCDAHQAPTTHRSPACCAPSLPARGVGGPPGHRCRATASDGALSGRHPAPPPRPQQRCRMTLRRCQAVRLTYFCHAPICTLEN